MLKIKKEPMTAEEVQPTWEMLVDLERKLQRNVRMSRILQPVGLAIFALNLLLASAAIAPDGATRPTKNTPMSTIAVCLIFINTHSLV